MSYRLRALLLLVSLSYLSGAYAQLIDPTRPADYIETDSSHFMTWELSAILISPERRAAVINSQPVQVGDQILGETIMAIEPNAVQLEGADGTMTLFLLDKTIQQVLDPS